MRRILIKIVAAALAISGVAAVTTSCNSSTESFSDYLSIIYVLQENSLDGEQMLFTPYVAYETYGDIGIKSGRILKDGREIKTQLYSFPYYSALMTTGETKFMSIEEKPGEDGAYIDGVEGKYTVEAVDTKGKSYDLSSQLMDVGEPMGVMEDVKLEYKDGRVIMEMNGVKNAQHFGVMLDFVSYKEEPNFWQVAPILALDEVKGGEDEVWKYEGDHEAMINNIIQAYEKVLIYPVTVNKRILLRGRPLIVSEAQ